MNIIKNKLDQNIALDLIDDFTKDYNLTKNIIYIGLL